MICCIGQMLLWLYSRMKDTCNCARIEEGGGCKVASIMDSPNLNLGTLYNSLAKVPGFGHLLAQFTAAVTDLGLFLLPGNDLCTCVAWRVFEEVRLFRRKILHRMYSNLVHGKLMLCSCIVVMFFSLDGGGKDIYEH